MTAVDFLTHQFNPAFNGMRSPTPSRTPSRPPSRPRTPAILDHRMYPHIMDAVFAGVSPAGSLVLRATSREFRDRVDNELWRHIAVGPSETGAGISVAAAGGSMPLRVTHCGHTTHASDCAEATRAPTEIYPALLGRARVVSIRGPVDAYGGSLA